MTPQRIFLFVALAALSILGNYANVPLFFSVSFIFGSVAALVAVRWLGILPGTLIAAIGGAYTWVLWGHPYAMIIFTFEALLVGLLMRRFEKIALADMLYWIFVGCPLVVLFYRVQMELPESAVGLIAIKQAVNGIFNAVLSAFVIMAIRLWLPQLVVGAYPQIRVSSLVFNVLLMLTLVAGTAPIISNSYQALKDEERAMQHKLEDTAQWLSGLLQKASDGEQVTESIVRVAKVLPDGKVLNFALLGANDALLGQHGTIRSLGENGTLKVNEHGINIWQPDGPMASMVRWRQSRYTYRVRLEQFAPPVTLLLEYEAGVLIKRMDTRHFESLLYISILTGIAIVLSLILSTLVTRPIRALAALSKGIASQVVQSPAPQVQFPESHVREYDDLSGSLKNMTGDLAASYGELRSIKENLEALVQERTAELHRLSMVASQTTNGGHHRP